MNETDHDYCSEHEWKLKPILPLSQLGILAVMNSKEKSLPAHKITAFIRRHFPYHEGISSASINKIMKMNQLAVTRLSQSDEATEEYYIPDSKLAYCIRKYSNLPMDFNSTDSPAYYMQFPCTWDQMAAGELEEEYEEDVDHLTLKQIKRKGKWEKPSIPERFLIALAILNSTTGRLLASEIFAFIEHHFPYYRTADKKWKKQNANEALKAIRGMFGRDKLTSSKKDRVGNGALNVYYIREDRMVMFKQFFAKYAMDNPDPTLYGLLNPGLWPAMINGELKEDVEKARSRICSWGKARTQMEKSGRDPYEKTEEQIGKEVIKPLLPFRLFAFLGYLHLRQESLFPTQLFEWLQSNIFYFRFANPSWKTQMKFAVYKSFIKKPAENIENLKGNEEINMFTVNEERKRRLINELLLFQLGQKDITIEAYGVASKEKWNRIFPPEFREMYSSVGSEAESDAESEDMEEFLVDDDYDLERDVGVRDEIDKNNYEDLSEEHFEDEEYNEKDKGFVKMSREKSTPPTIQERRYGTRRKQIDFNKMVNDSGEILETTKKKKRSSNVRAYV